MTCLVTRAVHLEILDSLGAESFCRAFRRFTAHRAVPGKKYSDNGSNFHGFVPVLKELHEHPQMKNLLQHYRTQWTFIPAYAPWMGGVWERLIGGM